MKNLFTAYNSLLKRHPLVTNCITTGVLMGSGDILAQSLFPTPTPTPTTPQELGLGRTLRAVIFGSCVFGPVGHKWYHFLGTSIHWPFTSSSRNKLKTTLLRVLIDQTIFVPFLCYPLYYSSMTVLEGKRPIWGNMKRKFEEKWWGTVRTNWMVWPVVQFVNFHVLPAHLRLLLINFVSVGWNTFLSYTLHTKSKI
ncbi:Protein SYM1 [Candida viswanathii]|uniref:Protein SYM1 n=1 Tax=Candida viswanathii TaxID=5486 RepID=A0A367YPF8_9ASCO|nr:Protein SYM1 [Candida viswanathii]